MNDINIHNGADEKGLELGHLNPDSDRVKETLEVRAIKLSS